MIQEKLKELELQLNYVCYDKELITRLSKVWDAYYDLKSEVKKLNIPDVMQRSELLLAFVNWYNEQEPYEYIPNSVIDRFNLASNSA